MAREILLSKKTEQGLRLDPRTKLLLIFIISIFVMGGTGGEAMGLIRLVLCAVPALLLLTSKQFVKAVSYIAVFSVFYAVLPAYEILDPFAITISQQIKIHADKMADASTHHKEMKNLM